MPATPPALIQDLVDWLAAGPRPYAEVMEAWRTSCPRLTIWEDAVDGALVVRRVSETGGVVVELTRKGRAMARSRGGGAGEDRNPRRLVRHP